MAASRESAPGELIRRLVQRIPKGCATSYGVIGRAAAVVGRPVGGARTVAWILASSRNDETLPWHRVVGAGGVILLPDRRGSLQRKRLRSEGVRFARGVIDPRHLIGEIELLNHPEATRKGRSRG